MPTICKLLDIEGRSISNPTVIEASVSWRQADGIAQASDPAGRLVAELRNARPEWIEAGGIRIVGVEPVSPRAHAVRAQEWQFNPQ